MQVHNDLLKELGKPPAKTYHAVSSHAPRTFGQADCQNDFTKMLEEEKLDVLVVTTVDATHDEYIIPALYKGIKVLTEKPMTT
jgi:predicted dehydrogenase